MSRLKAVDVDFLCYRRRTKKEFVLKIFSTLLIFVIIFLFAVLFYSEKSKKNRYVKLKEKIESQIQIKKAKYLNLGKKLKKYEKQYGSLVKETNNIIDYKAFLFDNYIEYLRKYQGVLITNFSFEPDFKIRIEVKSQDYNTLLNFKKFLETKFICNIREDRKQQSFFYQTMILRVKDER